MIASTIAPAVAWDLEEVTSRCEVVKSRAFPHTQIARNRTRLPWYDPIFNPRTWRIRIRAKSRSAKGELT